MKESPDHILLANEAGDSIEIRTGDIEAFLAGEPEPDPKPEPKLKSDPEPEPEPEPDKPTPPASSGSGSSDSSQSQPTQPTYTVAAESASYDVSAASVTVKITNTSGVEGGFGYAHRIECYTGVIWEPLALDIAWIDIWVILPAGHSITVTFSLHQEQYDYLPGRYRIAFTDGLEGAFAEFVLTGKAEATYSIVADPNKYPITSDSITVKITNTSWVEGGYGYAYRIERNANGKWEVMPLDFDVQEIAAILPSGKTNTETFSLHQNQYDYQLGKYRIVFLDGLGGASAGFTLE